MKNIVKFYEQKEGYIDFDTPRKYYAEVTTGIPEKQGDVLLLYVRGGEIGSEVIRCNPVGQPVHTAMNVQSYGNEKCWVRLFLHEKAEIHKYCPEGWSVALCRWRICGNKKDLEITRILYEKKVPLKKMAMQCIRRYFAERTWLPSSDIQDLFRREVKLLTGQPRSLRICNEGSEKIELSIQEAYNLSLQTWEHVHSSQGFSTFFSDEGNYPTFQQGEIIFLGAKQINIFNVEVK